MPITSDQMNLVRAALAQRNAEGSVAGGSPAPAITQATPGMPGVAPAPAMDIAAPDASQVPTAPTPPANGGSPATKIAKGTQLAQGPNFDEETRTLAKALTKKLLDAM